MDAMAWTIVIFLVWGGATALAVFFGVAGPAATPLRRRPLRQRSVPRSAPMPAPPPKAAAPTPLRERAKAEKPKAKDGGGFSLFRLGSKSSKGPDRSQRRRQDRKKKRR